MTTINGRLSTGTPNTSYRSHRIQLEFEEKVILKPSSPVDKSAKEVVSIRTAASRNQSLFKPALRSVNVGDDGQFAFQLPAAGEMRGLFTLTVLAPDGETLLRETFEKLPASFSLKVDPKPAFQISTHPDPFFGKRLKLTGKVVDAASPLGSSDRVGNLEVLLWGRQKDDQQGSFTVVLEARTDSQGYFSNLYPRGSYVEAFGQVVGSDVKLPVPLEEGSFPRHVILVFPLPESKNSLVRASAPSRAPDPDDLVNSPESYSSDKGAGECIDFTTPNRVVEEFSFSSIVRTTEPAIKGLTLKDPVKLPGAIIDLLAVKSFERLNLLTDPPPSPDDSPAGAGLKVAKRAAAQPAAAQARAAVDAEEAVKILRKQGLTVSPEILKHLSQDPDGFTPRELMTAERLSAHEFLHDLLDTLEKPAPGRAELNAENIIDWDFTPKFYQAVEVAHGHLLNFRQVWRADGYSLGDLVYSLPLAPCQKKQIVILDWERRETAQRTETLTEEEQLAASLSRDRDIQEIVRSSLSESLRGSSSATTFGIGGGVGGFIGTAVFGVGGGVGGASSEARQDSARQLSADSMQRLRDRVMQSASSVRSQRATVVQTVRQGETVRAETEVVVNHNHCHALTIQYFEVLRHFQVNQEISDVQECLFVPLLMSHFDQAKALRWREPLRRFLLDRKLETGFDAVERIRLGSDLPQKTYAEEDVEYLDGELRLSMTIARPRDPTKDEEGKRLKYYEDVWGFWKELIGGNVADIYEAFLDNQQDKDLIFREQLAPRVARALVNKLMVEYVDANRNRRNTNLDASLVSEYRPGTSHYITLGFTDTLPTIQRDQVTSIRISNKHDLPPGSKVLVESAFVRYRTEHLNHTLFRGQVRNDLLTDREAFLPTPLDRVERRNPRKEDIEIARRLVAHLNENLEYYHRAIWLSMDAERRFMLMDGFEAPNSSGRSVASVVENRLIGIVGNSLVLPVTRGFQLDPTYKQIKGDVDSPAAVPTLLDLYAPVTPIPPMRISVPTRGVFAEAVMGECNSCEEIDDTRFWRWDEAPCGDEPTAILPVSTDTRRTEPGNLQPTPFPASIINLQNAPSAPDPTGLASALQVLGSADLFKDITGLTENQKNALAALQSSLSTAQFFGGKAVDREIAKRAADLETQKRMSQNINRVMNLTKQLEDSGDLTSDQAKSLREAAIKTFIGGNSEAPAEPAGTSDLMELASSAGQNKASISVERSTGERINIDAKPEMAGIDSRAVATEQDISSLQKAGLLSGLAIRLASAGDVDEFAKYGIDPSAKGVFSPERLYQFQEWLLGNVDNEGKLKTREDVERDIFSLALDVPFGRAPRVSEEDLAEMMRQMAANAEATPNSSSEVPVEILFDGLADFLQYDVKRGVPEFKRALIREIAQLDPAKPGSTRVKLETVRAFFPAITAAKSHSRFEVQDLTRLLSDVLVSDPESIVLRLLNSYQPDNFGLRTGVLGEIMFPLLDILPSPLGESTVSLLLTVATNALAREAKANSQTRTVPLHQGTILGYFVGEVQYAIFQVVQDEKEAIAFGAAIIKGTLKILTVSFPDFPPGLLGGEDELSKIGLDVYSSIIDLAVDKLEEGEVSSLQESLSKIEGGFIALMEGIATELLPDKEEVLDDTGSPVIGADGQPVQFNPENEFLSGRTKGTNDVRKARGLPTI